MPRPEERTRRLEETRRLVRLLDDAIRVPFTNFRIGLDPIIGLFPGIGDFAGAVLSGLVLLQALRLGAPSSLLLNIAFNIVMDHAIGSIPLFGDVFDAVFKVNRRNLDLLERHLVDRESTRRESRKRLVVVGILIGLLFFVMLGVMALMAWGVWQVLGMLLHGASAR